MGCRNDTTANSASITALLPIMGVVLVAFLVIGLALPVLPLHVHQGLGLSTFVVGLVTGSQFAASLISRVWSGHYADRRGAKRAVVVGLLTAVVAGLLYLLSLRFVGTPWLSVTILLFGRALLGGAESFVITGAVSWGLAIAGHQQRRTSHSLGWDVDVRRPCVRGPGRHHALRDGRVHGSRGRDDLGSAHHGVAG